MNIIDELAKLEKEIQNAKTSINQLEGRQTEILDRLKTEFQVDSLAEAEELLEEMEGDFKKIDAQIRKDFDTLKGTFSW